MTDERPVHGQDEHFDELLDGRVITEAMTNFPEGTPLRDVLQWLHDRLSIQEAGHYIVQGFSADAEYFQPTFTADAVKLENFPKDFTMDARFPVTPIDPAFIPANAWFTGAATLDASIFGQEPRDKYYLYDDFTNQQDHGWGDGDVAGSYTYASEQHKYNHLKSDFDTDPIDLVFDYRGRVIEEDDSYDRYTYVNDDSLMNKRVLICTNRGHPNTTQAFDKMIEFRGGNNYVKITSNIGGDVVSLWVDGAQVGTSVSISGEFHWYKIEALDHKVRFKVWAEGAGEPSTWTRQTTTASLTTGRTAIRYNGQLYRLIITQPNGSPWTHYTKHFSVQGINAGPIPASAYLRPSPFSASAWLSSGDDWQVDAFVLPTFRADALLVNYVPGNFTIGAFREGRWEYDWGADAFIEGYGNIDAVISSDAEFGSFTADAWRVLTTESSFLEDSVVKDLERTYTFGEDAVVKDLDLPGSFTADAYKNLLIEGSHTIDAFKNPGAHPPFNAVIKRPDQSGDFKVDAVTWPQGVELYVANAVQKTLDNTEDPAGNMDATFVDIGRDEMAHWDDFNRSYDTDHSGWGNPSSETAGQTARGIYHYKNHGASSDVADSNMWRFDVNGNQGRFYEKNHYYAVHTEKIANDREFYMEFRHQTDNLVGGHYRVGIHASSWAGTGGNEIFVHMKQASGTQTQQLYVNGSVRDSVSMVGTNNYVVIKARLIDDQLQWKIWRRDSESEPSTWREVDMSAYWTPQDGYSFWACQSGNYFGTKGPWYHYYDKWHVESLAGYPYGFNQDAIIKVPDQAVGFPMDSYFVPQPFSVDAFIEGWGTIDARIWLGTTFPADATIEAPHVETEAEITWDFTSAHGAGSWTHSPPAGAEMLVVYGARSGSASATYGNITMTSVNTVIHYINLRDCVGRDDDVIRMASSSSVQGSVWLISKQPIEYVKNQSWSWPRIDMTDDTDRMAARWSIVNWSVGKSGNGFSGATVWTDDGDAGTLEDHKPVTGQLLSQAGSNNPITGWNQSFLCNASGADTYDHTTGLVTATYSGNGTAYLFRALPSPIGAEAWIMGGGHVPFDAQFTGSNINAIKKTVDNLSTMTVDAYKHVLGEQLKSLTVDAYTQGSQPIIEPAQFGWMELGQWMWGDVWPEVQHLHFSMGANLEIKGEGDFDADAWLAKGGTFTLDAWYRNLVNITGDAIFLKGYSASLTADASIASASGAAAVADDAVPGIFQLGETSLGDTTYTEIPFHEGLWYSKNRGEARTEPLNIWLWRNYG